MWWVTPLEGLSTAFYVIDVRAARMVSVCVANYGVVSMMSFVLMCFS